ncbi:MAG: hypothetical protein H0V70_08965 [Ktedonobacteraceae bacterium]|nr:hypothetical protein [Ktedonobacteraceae bacterium]
MTLPDLPPHTCYVEIWPSTYQRLFRKSLSLVEVYNDHGETALLFRLLREQPQALLEAVKSDELDQHLSDERACYQRLLRDWHFSQQTMQNALPKRVEALRANLLAPYRRLRTVLFEALEWRDCLERYNDPRALHILEPPWTRTERDEWAALQLRLARSRMQWRLALPRDIADRRFPGSSIIAQEDNVIWLAPSKKG